jgi:hypothetical protein|tara:strand:- start:76769 stop:76951 length:183 start_codon:yes stop_codon:yes gene_type:complete
MNPPTTFKKAKFPYPELGLTSYTNGRRKYHMLNINKPPTEITQYDHFNYAQKLTKAGNYA